MQVNRSFNPGFLILELSSRRIAWRRLRSYVTIVGWRHRNYGDKTATRCISA